MLTMTHANKGFTLLEVMVAVFVLSIGLLGLAQLQVVTLKTTQSADFKSQASILAVDMLNRMKANQKAAYEGKYVYALDGTPPEHTDPLAEIDWSQWKRTLAQQLPLGLGSIDCPAYDKFNEFVCTITITWTDIQTGTADDTNYNERAISTLTLDGAI